MSYSVDRLPKFKHFNAATVAEAVSLLKGEEKAKAIAGGSVLLWGMKIRLESYKTLVNLNTIPNMNYIKVEAGTLKIGALATLGEIAKSQLVGGGFSALAQGAGAAASPQIRNRGTIGGNICQGPQCWFFRAPEISCLRKNPAGPCYAVAGDNTYHSIFGGVAGCFAVNPSDTAAALVALNAKIVTSKRTIDAEKFFASGTIGVKNTVLDDDELVTEIQAAAPAAGTKSAYLKFTRRKAFDFPIVSCAAAIGGGAARICLNGVHGMPYRATKAEDAVKGKAINEANAEAAGEAAITEAKAMSQNKWLIHAAKGMVKKAILACA